jgi:hypothetical protein
MRLLAIALTGILIVLSVVGIVGAFALPARRLLGLRDVPPPMARKPRRAPAQRSN